MFAKNYGKRQRQLAFKSYNQKWKERKDELHRARLVRESSSVVRVGSEMGARNPPVLRAATLRQRRPCGRELRPHRATQTRAPDRWKSTRATCNWQGVTWSSLIATFNWPTARNQNGSLCSCQQLSEKQEMLFRTLFLECLELRRAIVYSEVVL